MKKNIIVILAASLLLTGCGLHKEYVQNVVTPTEPFGTTQDILSAGNGTSMARLSWREFFTDPLLQQLIEQALASNTDINSARIAVEKR